jgi:hypothetical protein
LLETHEKEKHQNTTLNGFHQQNGFAKEEDDRKGLLNVKTEMEDDEPTLRKNSFIRPKIRIVPFDRKSESEDKKCSFSEMNELKSPIKLVTEIVVLRTPNGITLQQKTSDADLLLCQTDLPVNSDSQLEVPEKENMEVNESKLSHRKVFNAGMCTKSQTKSFNLQSEDHEASKHLNHRVETKNAECNFKRGPKNAFNFHEEDETTAIVPFTSLRSKSVSKSSNSSKNEILAEKENTSTNADSNAESYQNCRDVIEDMLTAIVKMESWKKKKAEQKHLDSKNHIKTDSVLVGEATTETVVKVKGKRGRKKKIVNLEDNKTESKELKLESSTATPVEVKVPKKRGRKRKYPLPPDPDNPSATLEMPTTDGSNQVSSGEPKKRKTLAELLLTDLSYQWGEDDFEGAEIIFETSEEQTKETWTIDCDLTANETFCYPCNYQPMSGNELRNHVMMKHTYKRDKQSLNLEKEQDWMISETNSKDLSCSICDFKVLNHEELAEHFKDKHTSVKQENLHLQQKKRWKVPKSRIKTCTVCGYDAKSSFLLQRHARQVHNIRINPSSKQQQQIPNGNEPIVSGELPKCIPCNRTFTRGQDLVRHKLFAHTNMKQIICEFCSKRFWRQDSFKIHIETVHPGSTPTPAKATAVEDKKTETETYEDSIMSQDVGLAQQCFPVQRKKFVCNQCGRKYQQRYLLEKHMRFVHPNCSFKKTDKGIFSTQKIKRFLCPYKHCGKMFSNLKKLRFHESDVHLASKGLKIRKDFMEVKNEMNVFDLENLSPTVVKQDDTNTQDNEDSQIRPRPHKCSKCWKSYTRRHHLKRHMISSHGHKAEDFEDERLKSSTVFYQKELPEGVSDVIADFTVKEFDR